MNKPMSLIIDETKQSIVEIINNSNLHPSLVEMIIKDIYWEVNRLNMETMKREKEVFLSATSDSMDDDIKNKEK